MTESSQVYGLLADNPDLTVHVANLNGEFSDAILWELFSQTGPIDRISVPRDTITGKHMSMAFVSYFTAEDAEYTCKILDGIYFNGHPLAIMLAYGQQVYSGDRDLFSTCARVYIAPLPPFATSADVTDFVSAFAEPVEAATVNVNAKSAIVAFADAEDADIAIAGINATPFAGTFVTARYSDERSGAVKGSAAKVLKEWTAARRLLNQAAVKVKARTLSHPFPHHEHFRASSDGPTLFIPLNQTAPVAQSDGQSAAAMSTLRNEFLWMPQQFQEQLFFSQQRFAGEIALPSAQNMRPTGS